MNKRLDAVSRARQAYILAKSTLEQKLQEQLREELSNLNTQVDIAVRYAFDSGESKASILRAMGTKDYGTLNAALARTDAVTEVPGVDPLDSVYRLDGDVLHVSYREHGPQGFSGDASFDVKRLEGGSVLLLARDALWSDDYRTRNDVVAVLDGVKDGFYYEEAITWIGSKF